MALNTPYSTNMKLHISSADLRLAYSVAVSVSFSSWMIRNRLKLKMSKGELLIFPLFQQQLLPSHLMTVLSIPFFRPKALRSSLTFLFRLHLTQSASKCYRLYLKNKQSLTFSYHHHLNSSPYHLLPGSFHPNFQRDLWKT